MNDTAPAETVAPALSIRELSKSYVGNLALESFDLDLMPGEIHVLVGENGSGKSTLIKILCGYHAPDVGGHVFVNGETLQFQSPSHAHRLGCRFVHQELGLLPTLSVLDNLSLGSGYPTWVGTIRTKIAKEVAAASLARLGLGRASIMEPVANLSAAQRTGVALARALRDDSFPVRVLVLDEPTAALPVDEVAQLLRMLRTAADSGVAILFVTHHLDEVFRLADRVTVLRDGRKVGSSGIADIDRESLVHQMVGGEVESVRQEVTQIRQTGLPVVEVERLTAGVLRDVSLSVRAGEIVGVAGLTGSGRDSLLGAIFGAVTREDGTVTIGGRVVPPNRPDLSIGRGAAFLPADRKTNGGIMSMSAYENFTLAKLAPYWSRFRLDSAREKKDADRWFDRLQVRPSGAATSLLATFSGGNQQKIVLGKWLRTGPAVLIIDEPTQGVDIGAKAVLHRKIVEAAAAGAAVLFSSTDTEELTTLADRIVVLRSGSITDELMGTSISSAAITRATVAGSSLSEMRS